MIELEKAAAGAARRKLQAGIEPRENVSDGLRFQHESSTATRIWYGVLAASALTIVGIILSYVIEYVPHIRPEYFVLVGFAVAWAFSRRKHRS